MKKKIVSLLALTVAALLATGADTLAQHYVPRPHHACRTHYVRRTVKIKERRHHRIVRKHGHIVWVKQARCVYVAPKATAPTRTAPTTPAVQRYSTRVDPSFTQNPSNPLAVTYAYSGDATENGVDLGAAGQLPAGVLNFYSPTAPGGPMGLICSMNVGGSTVGGNCLVNYTATGTYQVTTQYVPNSATAVTQTDTETIAPYDTTTTVQSQYTPEPLPQNGTLSASYSVTGQGLGTISPSAGSLSTTITDTVTGQSATWAVGSSGSCNWYVDTSQSQVQFQAYGSCPGPAATAWLPGADFTNSQIVVTAQYAGMPGWSGSTSKPVAADSQ